MGYNTYIAKCQCSSPGIKTFTLSGMILRTKDLKKFSKRQAEEKAKEHATAVLERMISNSGASLTVEDFKMKIALKGIDLSFIDVI